MDECKLLLERIAVAVEAIKASNEKIDLGQTFVVANLSQIKTALGVS